MLQKAVNIFALSSPHAITTERVSLYPSTSLNTEQLTNLMKENLANLICHSEAEGLFIHPADYLSIASQINSEHSSASRLHFAYFSNNQLIGFISSDIKGDPKDRSVNLNFWYANYESAESYCIESILCIMKHHTESDKTRKFYISCGIGNFACERIAKLLGFKLECINLSGDKQLKIFSTSELLELSEFRCHITN